MVLGDDGLPQIADNKDQMVELLAQIAANTAESGRRQLDPDDPTPQYYSSGPSPILVETDSWEEIEFGIRAKSVNIRTSNDLLVAFQRPHDRPGNQILIEEYDSPFTVGGDAGIDSRNIWLKTPDHIADPPEVRIIALD